MDDNDTPVADKTPETPKPTEPVQEPEKPTSEPTHDDSLRETVARLEGVVSGLAARVEQIVTAKPQDEGPVSKPWTHKSIF
jgi:hypothetical protein